MSEANTLNTCTVRPIRESDMEDFLAFAELAGVGMTSMPHDRRTLENKITRSVRSFEGAVRGADAEYFMVMEDSRSRSLVGCTAVYPCVGTEHGFFSYRLLKQIRNAKEIGIRIEIPALHLTNELTGLTEVGSLILHPDWRGTGGGRLLARTRYLLIAEFPHLFADTVFAEMRGWISADGRSPFWESVGERFFGLPYAEADHLSATRGNEFIADLMPTHPIYLDMLPRETRELIGRPHRDSAPAMAMLLKEGFAYRDMVDVFDAGPQVLAQAQHIKTVRESRVGTIGDTDLFGDSPRLIAATRSLDDFSAFVLNAESASAPPPGTSAAPGTSIRVCAF